MSENLWRDFLGNWSNIESDRLYALSRVQTEYQTRLSAIPTKSLLLEEIKASADKIVKLREWLSITEFKFNLRAQTGREALKAQLDRDIQTLQGK